MNKLFISLTTIISLGASLIAPLAANAKTPTVVVRDPKNYAAKFISQSEKDPIAMEAGSTKIIDVRFKNIGSATWDASSNRFVSAYTMEPRDRASVFKGNNWLSAKQTGKMEGVVKPGQTGTLKLALTAPEKTGTYTEKFYLSAENYSWIKGGYFYVTVKVHPKKAEAPSTVEQPAPSSESVPVSTHQYKGKLLGQTLSQVQVRGGEEVQMTVLVQNIGKQAWSDYAFVANSPTGLAAATKLSFAHEQWVDAVTAMKKSQPIDIHGVVREQISFRAPVLAGTYVARFSLQTNGQPVENSSAEVTVHVTENAAIIPETANTPAPEEPPRLAAEPRIRVGMHLPMDYAQFVSEHDDYRVLANGTEVVVVPKDQLAVVRYEDGVYTLTVASQEFTTTEYFRFEPLHDVHAPFALPNYQKRVAWKGNPNFNAYRGAFEYRRGQIDKLMYAVNDVLLEDYVAGIAETSNLAPYEYIKALLTAARTYAYVSIGKYPFFDVLANTYDQLYLGYNSEILMPKVAQASRDTRAKMITHNNAVVVTPYFANSSGQTKSWTSVWGGRSEKPWLQPVSATYDVGQPMRGHGVGMSARDAAQRADKEGVDWVYLVKYYYTGVELARMYE